MIRGSDRLVTWSLHGLACYIWLDNLLMLLVYYLAKHLLYCEICEQKCPCKRRSTLYWKQFRKTLGKSFINSPNKAQTNNSRETPSCPDIFFYYRPLETGNFRTIKHWNIARNDTA
jgi:hypothetical protein